LKNRQRFRGILIFWKLDFYQVSRLARTACKSQFAFDIFDILKTEIQQKCRVFEFKNSTFIKRIEPARLGFSLS